MTLTFALVLGVSGTAAALIFSILYRPLLKSVIDLCGTENRDRFWTIYSGIMIVLSPILMISWAALSEDFLRDDFLLLQQCVFWAGTGVMLALLVFRFMLWISSNRLFELREAEHMRFANGESQLMGKGQ
ncbi:hypothetical protein SAMN06297251_103251 [Fulvimarina manganoxydans]|uniref:Uncharacterized protein n=1 Tax=Fulvimarina manganoxydans TaxID=937218 RepID=A0A1W1ZZP4_9HYPH|nr:hypothetical protein [Fulvimarina manganoxydans]SMC53860.1 hypothetical protein SAMN06297251_103251 [Fulvimarina manganoxydans]